MSWYNRNHYLVVCCIIFCFLMIYTDLSDAKGRPKKLKAAEEDPRLSIQMDPGQSLIEQIEMTVNLSVTDFKIHKQSDATPFTVIIPGTFTASVPIVWNLMKSDITQSILMLYPVTDVNGYSNFTLGDCIPISYDISINGGPFQPMIIQGDNTISTVFPPGLHTFEVRITGSPQYHQTDGYYRLELVQNIVPQN